MEEGEEGGKNYTNTIPSSLSSILPLDLFMKLHPVLGIGFTLSDIG